MPYQIDGLVSFLRADGRKIWHYENPRDTVGDMLRPGYFPTSLEVDEIVPCGHGVFLIERVNRMLASVTAALDDIADEVLDP